MTVRRYTGFSAFLHTLRYAWSREGREINPIHDLEEEGLWEFHYDIRWKPWTWWRAFKGAVVIRN